MREINFIQAINEALAEELRLDPKTFMIGLDIWVGAFGATSGLTDEFGKERTHKFAVGLMLGIAYASSVGGLTTLVGTPPNLSFVRIFEILQYISSSVFL